MEKSQAPRSPRRPIGRVGVLGAGTMGARIAAHVANAGVPVLLLDRVSEERDRNTLPSRSIEELKKVMPYAFVDPSAATDPRSAGQEPGSSGWQIWSA